MYNNVHNYNPSPQGLKEGMKKKRQKITAKDLRRIKYKATRNPLSSSATTFKNCNLPGVSRSKRCQVLRDMARIKMAETHHHSIRFTS